MKTYTTRDEAIYNEIVIPLGEHYREHDIEAIAAEVIADEAIAFDPHERVFYCAVRDNDEFWNVVERNVLTPKRRLFFDFDVHILRDEEGKFASLDQLADIIDDDGIVTVQKWSNV